jgi:hypothetical protein
VGNEVTYINYPDRGHSLVGKYDPGALKKWLLGHAGTVNPGEDPIENWSLDENGISDMDEIEIPAKKVFGLTEIENPTFPEDNLYRSAMKIYQAYRKTKSSVPDRTADGVAFVHQTAGSPSQRILLDAPIFEDLGTNGDLCLVELGSIKAVRFYTMTTNEWGELQNKIGLVCLELKERGYALTNEQRARILTIMDGKRRFWEVRLGIE